MGDPYTPFLEHFENKEKGQTWRPIVDHSGPLEELKRKKKSQRLGWAVLRSQLCDIWQFLAIFK